MSNPEFSNPVPNTEQAPNLGELTPMQGAPETPINIENPNPFLTGPRQVGTVPRPDGSATVHFIDAEGAKIVQHVKAPRAQKQYATAMDFYDEKERDANAFEDEHGFRPAGAGPRAEAAPQIETRKGRVGRFLGKALGR